MSRATYLALVLVGSMMALAGPAHAQLETLIMPGEVVEAHAEYEGDCANCHQRFDRAKQRALCMECHSDVTADIDAGAGFHGKFADARDGNCAACHTDHKGRSAEIIVLDERGFDHDFTDFTLFGAHAETNCTSCHAPEARHRDAPSDCYACHEKDNPHGDTLGTACGDCHTPNDWRDVEFDHDTTGFPLVGKHQGAACLQCHEDETFRDTPTTCFGCHASDDAHDGLSGDDCGQCHSPSGWHDTSFDHSRDTRFALEGAHARQACDDCHSADPFSDKLDMRCIACHRDDDHHDGHFGEQCDSCHASSAWSGMQFDHAAATGHVLSGAHGDLECTACHLEPLFEASPGTDCLACHEDDDPHSGTLGAWCNDCHSDTAWPDNVFFDHGFTRFPLLGSHTGLDCADCHESRVFSDAPDRCVDCHRDDDAHDGRLGESCAMCHNPVEWLAWTFDHDLQTGFALDGAHADASCDSCHRAGLSSQRGLGNSCADCHRSDDVHDGEFGPDCARCHSSESFSEVRSIR